MPDKTEVRIIKEQNDLILVEWLDEQDMIQRSWVLRDMMSDVQKKAARVTNIEEGIPYGIPFDKYLTITVDSKRICRELRKRGIWTADDVQTNPKAVLGALQAAYGIDLANLVSIARDYENSTEDTL